ncbi:MAG: alpha-glucan family phosphorylase, partial [Bacteroidales bacterium]|nr:alpha-glucan family phosphorylase [Bacteroidales bacterium]
GIHTVISTKAITIQQEFGDKYILIGPDVWRESREHPEFEEDLNLLSGWKQKALSEGLRIRVGRWKIAGRPLVILIDFTTYFNRKDEIFSRFWESYKLDSITGQWDYIEPTLFGYASGQVIESYVKYHLTSYDKVVAQFHEWMTGSGLLYLRKQLPQVGTVFTTHATVIGRSIAGNLQPLYSKMSEYNGDVKATEFQVVSKQSMEKTCAANADAFTTVSELTSHECRQFLEKEVDLITPNGFEDSFVPGDDFDLKRKEARELLLKVASAIIGNPLSENAFIVANSGRYEFKNKGIDLFIDALGKLNKNGGLDKEILALILIPANHYGARKDLIEKLNNPDHQLNGDKFLTHNLHYSEHDPIMKRIREAGLENNPEDKVKIIFAPSYLNGSDGIFNKPYYDLLIGMDLTVFPSYYEPWGYTPLESLAFHIPTVTTTLAGFGLWVKDEYKDPDHGIFVLNRNDSNDSEVVDGISGAIQLMQALDAKNIAESRKIAFEISRIALWKNLIDYYKEAYSIAIEKVSKRSDTFVETERVEQLPQIDFSLGRTPTWKKVIIQQNLSKRLKPLEELSKNLWWSWNHEAIDLFASIDSQLWEESARNPIDLIDKVSFERLSALENDKVFLATMDKVYADFRKYMEDASYSKPQVAYFSMEYGLQETLKIYSGGLGLLAGDYLKEASDYNYNIIGVGLLYRYGYFTQDFSPAGEQISLSIPLHFSKLPVTPLQDDNGNWKTITIALPGRDLKARIWRVDVGRVKLYLLDADFDENMEHDHSVTHQLYGGDNENRFKQELLLGIGGIRALRLLGYEPDLYHCNEGHAAFIGLERLREYIQEESLTYPEALDIVRTSTLFTTHTPVPAGHDYFDEDLMRTYIAHYPSRLKIDWNQFMNLGKMHFNHPGEKFSMSCLAVNLSQEVNGVSKLHGEVSRKMFADMWKGYLPQEVPIGHVTNGVHVPSWLSRRWKEFYETHLDKDFLTRQEDRKIWEKITKVDQAEIWKIRNEERKDLIDYLKKTLRDNSAKSHENPKMLMEIERKINPDALTIGFARRFATYKRAHLLFRDLERLESIVNNPEKPVQFLFAGKAHPRDKAGQDLIRYIIEISRQERFRGKIIFLENYEIPLAKRLIHGVDIWLNTPTRPLEASGTSGEKVVMNGGLHFSVLDGWWAEGYKPGAGWALQQDRVYDDQELQDQLDAQTIYLLLENEIIPLFYKRTKNGIPTGWVDAIQKSISQVAPEFTMNRMLRDYIDRFYSKLYERNTRLKENDYEKAAKLASWKRRVLNTWDEIEVLSIQYPDVNKKTIQLGKEYTSELVIDLKSLNPEEIGLEFIVAEQNGNNSDYSIISSEEFELQKTEGSKAWYSIRITPGHPGIFDYGIRMYPRNPECRCRQDMNIVRWIS